MKRIIPTLLVAVSMFAGTAWSADDQPLRLDVTTLDDDLRAGGESWFVLRMYDGREQLTQLTSGQRLADQTTANYTVAPKPPYQWLDVKDIGLKARVHPGDGALQRRDEWKVGFVLRGTGGNCTTGLTTTRACIGLRNGRFHFQDSGTQYVALDAALGRCANDGDCNGGQFCGTGGKVRARCAVSSPGADRRGCVVLRAPEQACGTGLVCNEVENRCVETACAEPDKDGDGHQAIACGGDDCDDNDGNRYPGRTEVCDNRNHDEDCDVTTFGKRDLDGDGYFDASCKNIGS